MNRTMKKLIAGLLFTMMLLTLAACSSTPGTAPNETGTAPTEGSTQQQTYNIKFALDEPQGSCQDVYALKFKELVEAKSEGRVTLQIFYLGQLGSGTSQAELIQNGTVEFGFISCGDVGAMVPEGNIFGMPYIFPSNLEKAKEFLYNSEVINTTIVNCFGEKNLHVIDWLDEGYMQWTNSVRPITSTADMKGVKMRVMAAPILTAAYRAYGADPVTIPITELYSALQLNMAEGQVNPVEYIENMKYYEVQKYLTLANSDFYVASLQFNKDYWGKLPEDIQNIFLEAVQETRPYYAAEQRKLIDAATVNLKEYGMEVNELSDEAVADFRELAKGAVETFYEVGGENAKQLYADFVAEAELYY